MDERANERVNWIANLANQIEREVQDLVGAVENHRDDLEELRSAAAGLRMQAEALVDVLVLKAAPDPGAEKTSPPGEPAGAVGNEPQAGEGMSSPLMLTQGRGPSEGPKPKAKPKKGR